MLLFATKQHQFFVVQNEISSQSLFRLSISLHGDRQAFGKAQHLRNDH